MIMESNRLSKDDLKQVIGGAWTFDSISAAEKSEYDALEEARLQADMDGDWIKVNQIESQINSFIDKMDAKYGK